jgi:hypothetical protein
MEMQKKFPDFTGPGQAANAAKVAYAEGSPD